MLRLRPWGACRRLFAAAPSTRLDELSGFAPRRLFFFASNHSTSAPTRRPLDEARRLAVCQRYSRCFASEASKPPEPPEPPKRSLVQRFKQMYRDYWYVLVPVHLATSACWLTGFYYLAKSGVDVVALLQSLGISERFTDPLRDSSMGYVALTYALYKVATPVRYTVTLGGTTVSIKYLQEWGYIKPIPSKEKLKEMYQERKDGLQEMYQGTKQELRQRKYQIKERKDNVMSDLAKYKQEMEDIKRGELKNQDKQ